MREGADASDHEGGRQLAVLVGLVATVVTGVGGWLVVRDGPSPGSLEVLAVGALLTVVTCLAWWKPIIAIRVAMGRWGELVSDRDPTLKKTLDGVAAGEGPYTAVEGEVPKRTRARFGAGLMVLACVGAVALVAFADSIPDNASSWAGRVLAALFLGGLITWYRTR